MGSRPEFMASRTPISDGLAADLQALGSILGSHLRGLDAHLGRQQQRLVRREQQLLQDSLALQPAIAVELQSLSLEQLKALCRQHKLKGWSKLRRERLIDFLKVSLPLGQGADGGPGSGGAPGTQAGATNQDGALNQGGSFNQEGSFNQPDALNHPDGLIHPAARTGEQAGRIERLLLLVLEQLQVPAPLIEQAWHGPPTP